MRPTLHLRSVALIRDIRPVVVLGALLLSGCSALPSGRDWGQDATPVPGWRRASEAAIEAVESPRFWGPLAAAAVFQVDGWDRKVSNWARRTTPVFGSQHNAVDWSDRLRSASSFVYFMSVLATPSGGDPGEWILDKLRGAAVGVAAVAVTDGESALLKSASARERPNGQDTQSMPSAHTSRSAVLTTMAARNLQSLDLTETSRHVLNFGVAALTWGTAWARVESGFHFPSDTLVGMALGNFTGAFFNDAFLGLEQRPSASRFSVGVSRGGFAMRMCMIW